MMVSRRGSLAAVLLVAAVNSSGVAGWQAAAPAWALGPGRQTGRLAARGARQRAPLRPAGLAASRMVAVPGATSTATANDQAAWLRGWESAREELDARTAPAHCVRGEVPSDLVGTYYRNGPGLFELGKNKLAHPLDGDGMVAAWTFPGDGTCTVRSRFVRTEAHVKEQNAVKLGYEGPPITKSFFSGGKGDPKNCANTGVVYWGKRLLALYEASLPVELDPAGLHTVGVTRIAASLPKRSSFTARPKYDPASDRLVGMRYSPLAANAEAQFFEYDDSWQCVSRASMGLKGHAILHDFGVTRKHYVVHQAPSSINSIALSLGLQPPMECISYDESRDGAFHIVARDGGEPRTVAAPGSGFLFQIANAFENKETGAIVVDAIEMPRMPLGGAAADGSWKEAFDFGRDVPRAQLVRWTLPPGEGNAQRVVIDDAFQAFPEVNPYVKTVSHSFVYTAGGGGEQAAAPLKSVRKFDVRQGTVVGEYRVGPGEFVSGPSFVPRPDGRSEDDGYLLVTVLHAAQEGEAAPRTRLEVLDAMDLNKGPLCSIALEAYLPHSLYGSLCVLRAGTCPFLVSCVLACQKICGVWCGGCRGCVVWGCRGSGVWGV